jgi:hypothetical protein
MTDKLNKTTTVLELMKEMITYPLIEKVIMKLDERVLEDLEKRTTPEDMEFLREDKIWKEAAWRSLPRRLARFPAKYLIVRIIAGGNEFLLFPDDFKPDLSRDTFDKIWNSIDMEGAKKLKRFRRLFNTSTSLSTHFAERNDGTLILTENNTENEQKFNVKMTIFPAYPREFSFFFKLDQIEISPGDTVDWTEVKVPLKWLILQGFNVH